MPALTSKQKQTMREEYQQTSIGRAAQAARFGVTLSTQKRITKEVKKGAPTETGGYTLSQQAEIRELYEQGKSRREICEITGIGMKSVLRYCSNTTKGKVKRKLTDEQALEARELYYYGGKTTNIADKFNISKPALSTLLRGNTYPGQDVFPYRPALSDGRIVPSERCCFVLRWRVLRKGDHVRDWRKYSDRTASVINSLLSYNLCPNLVQESMFQRRIDEEDIAMVRVVHESGRLEVMYDVLLNRRDDKRLAKSLASSGVDPSLLGTLRYFIRLMKRFDTDDFDFLERRHADLQRELATDFQSWEKEREEEALFRENEFDCKGVPIELHPLVPLYEPLLEGVLQCGFPIHKWIIETHGGVM